MAMNEASAIQRFGTAMAEPALHHITVGEWSFAWQSGALRWLRVGEVEVVRGIAAVLRDPQWGTHAPIVDAEQMAVTDRHASLAQDFHLLAPSDSDKANCDEAGGEPNGTGEGGDPRCLRGQLRIEATEHSVTVDLTLEALSAFPTARSGLSVLLPLAGVAGAEIQVMHTDDRQETRQLPESISPSQPLFDIRQLSLSPVPDAAFDVTPDVKVRIDFEGDVFEMEDQRNWSDASFKIYNRPLAWPTPYVLEAGETLTQRITVSRNASEQASVGNEPAGRELNAPQSADRKAPPSHEPTSRAMPSIGCGVWLDRLDDLERLTRQLAAIAPGHLDALLDLRQPQALNRLGDLMATAAEHDVPVWLYVICEDHDPAASLAPLARELERLPNVRESLLKRAPAGLLVTPAAYLKSYQPGGVWPAGTSPSQALAAARERWPDMMLGGGVPTYFTELNRCRPDPAAIDFITHGVSPIVHAADDRSVMETLESIPAIVASCRALAPTALYRLTTTAIGAWTNPYGESLTANDGTRRVTLSDNDPRQQAQFAAAWSVGFVARATLFRDGGAGVDSLTLSSLGSPFDIGDEHDIPVRHVIAGLARASGQPLCQSPFEDGPFDTRSISADSLAMLAWRTDLPAINEVWVANLSAESTPLGALLSTTHAEIVDASLLVSERDGFHPAPEIQARLASGESVMLSEYAVLKLRWRDLSISTG